MKENGQNERLKKSEFEMNTSIMDNLIASELAKFTKSTRRFESVKVRYSGIEERAENFILHYAEAKNLTFENNSKGGIYSIKILMPLPDGQSLQIKFSGDRLRGQGSINAEFFLREAKKTIE